ncbi:MAG: DEAD/DEAH box helicase family protein [candidate division NC10 bacterium]|nr:DEAD/DEAH box helicase family protein [candidate division NC10 bacterium]
MDEKTTRKLLIDKALERAGWSPIVHCVPGASYDTAAVEEYETAEGPADYVLFDRGDALAAVEAKKLGLGPQNVLGQAQRYARGLRGGRFNFHGFRLPFVYSTNGEIFWFQDLREQYSRSRQVARFHTPSALREFLGRDVAAASAWLRDHPIEHQFLRPYQQDAIASIEEALISGKRRMLVAMATGTGKTFTTIGLIYRLMKSGFARRILFLVDRRALAAQAAGAMAAFEPEPGLKFDRTYEVFSQRFRREDLEEQFRFDPKVLPTEYLTDPKPRDAFVYVCTIQGMRINLFGREGAFGTGREPLDEEPDAEGLDIPIHAFDCIIADECHRGYTSTEESKWREVLDHFDGVKIGLTATPAAHTRAYFRDIVFRYEYERAVREGYLVDYDAVRIQSDVTMNGVFLKEGEEIGLKDTQTGQLTFDILEDERLFPAEDLEEKLTAPDRNRKIVKEFAKYARAQEADRGIFPKTLVFAVNDLPHISHSDQLVEMLREEFGKGDAFVQKITGSPTVDRPLQRIREFRNRPNPGIVVTVDMLSTGVDIPRLENILFLRPVKSRILFEQMLGRGTRRCDEIHKTHFTVFDVLGVLEYFRQASAFTADPPSKPTRPIREIIEAIHNNQDRDYNVRVLIKRLLRIAKNVSAEGRTQFAALISGQDLGDFARSLPQRLEQNWSETMVLLRSEPLLDYLENYPRAPRTFIVAETVEDLVVSDYIFRTADGRELKPEDYLVAFERFVKENPDRIEAIRILLSRPAEFRTEHLKELRAKLAARPERFTEPNLRRAYQNALADIISIVRHAALHEPLLAAQERVGRAIARIRAGRTFTPEQEGWLELIQAHLIENLVIEKADFQAIPFSRRGACGRANAAFEGRLEELLNQINEAMAA